MGRHMWFWSHFPQSKSERSESDGRRAETWAAALAPKERPYREIRKSWRDRRHRAKNTEQSDENARWDHRKPRRGRRPSKSETNFPEIIIIFLKKQKEKKKGYLFNSPANITTENTQRMAPM